MKKYLNGKITEEEFNAIREEGVRMINEEGYLIHYVPDMYAEGLPSIHTHGFKETFNAADIEIVLPVSKITAKGICESIKAKYEKGEFIEPYVYYRDIIKNYSVMFVEATDKAGRTLLRLLLPDINGRMPYDNDAADRYKNQLVVGRVNTFELCEQLNLWDRPVKIQTASMYGIAGNRINEPSEVYEIKPRIEIDYSNNGDSTSVIANYIEDLFNLPRNVISKTATPEQIKKLARITEEFVNGMYIVRELFNDKQ